MVDCKCKKCGKIFKVKSSYYQKTRKYCSKKCSNIANDISFKKGHKPLGRALPGHVTKEETKIKISKGNKGRKMSAQILKDNF